MTNQQIAALLSFHGGSSDGGYLSSSFLHHVCLLDLLHDRRCTFVFQGYLSGWNLHFLDSAWTSLHSQYRSTAVVLINTVGAVSPKIPIFPLFIMMIEQHSVLEKSEKLNVDA